MAKDAQINIRLKAEELSQLRDAAKKEGLTVTEFILQRCIYNAQDSVYTKPELSDNVYTKEKDVATKPKKAKPVQSGNTWKPYDKKAAAK